MKHREEERCAERPEGRTVGTCGVYTGGIFCASCTKPICFDHAHLCRICRDECKHHLFCSADLNTHDHKDIAAA